MAYQTAIKIKDVIQAIVKRKYILPSIQREFVWQPDQIEKLFDSIMRDYPISTFLFWKVDKEKVKDFQFYEFLKDYHEKSSRHNPKADLSNDEDVIAILDGQQRLTSLYIALRGSYAKKLPYYQWDSIHAFPAKKLYINLLAPADDIEMEYDFRFLTKDEAQNKEVFEDGKKPQFYWFPVGEILDFNDVTAAMNYLMRNHLLDTSKYSSVQASFAMQTITKLFNNINEIGTISYFQEEGEKLDKVLQIFIRINSGGTKLSYSDLLLSIATAQWKGDESARDVIHYFVDEVNQIGDGFDFNKDFVLKSCLVLGDFSDVKFKVDNFTKENMLHIENLWEQISNSLKIAVKLIARFGFNRHSLTSTNVVIPIAYYIFKNNIPESIVFSSNFEKDRINIYDWLVRVLLKGTFGGTPDALYPTIRNVINNNLGHFPIYEIIEQYKGTNKSIIFTSDDIEALLSMEYKRRRVFSALSILYPGLNHNFRYQKDHIHPQKYFTDSKLRKSNIVNPEELDFYKKHFNLLPNLQLLQATENNEKSAKPLKDWLEEQYPGKHDRNVYMQTHLFPEEESLDFSNFKNFYESRKALLREKLREVLKVGEINAS